ncbi:site-specific integrase [Microvirga puerhi]|uniref:site-specific integrase n=1 Tax=Microvirga puerhi TaxID=2876078 RepID=UPI0034E2899D
MSKHAPKAENRRTVFDPFPVAALRLLLLTGCRLREVLHLKWDYVDFERGIVFLPDSKTGRKPVVLNAPALAVLADLPRVGPYVVPSDDPTRPQHDLKKIWAAVSRRASLSGVRLHDLRHTFASIGAAGGLGLPIIGKLLGHSQAATTARGMRTSMPTHFVVPRIGLRRRLSTHRKAGLRARSSPSGGTLSSSDP